MYTSGLYGSPTRRVPILIITDIIPNAICLVKPKPKITKFNSQFDTPTGREPDTPNLTTYNNLRRAKQSRNPNKIIIYENSGGNPKLVHR